MTEIKVGDKVSVSGYAELIQRFERGHYPAYVYCDNDYGIVDCMESEEDSSIIVKMNGTYAGLYEVHRKQCRKLVKMRKCDECRGSGTKTGIFGQGMRHNDKHGLEPYTYKTTVTCWNCNGKGRVKIDG